LTTATLVEICGVEPQSLNLFNRKFIQV